LIHARREIDTRKQNYTYYLIILKADLIIPKTLKISHSVMKIVLMHEK